MKFRSWLLVIFLAMAAIEAAGCRSVTPTLARPTLLFPANTQAPLARETFPPETPATLEPSPDAGKLSETAPASSTPTPPGLQSTSTQTSTPLEEYPYPQEPIGTAAGTTLEAYPYPELQVLVGTTSSEGENPYPFPQEPGAQTETPAPRVGSTNPAASPTQILIMPTPTGPTPTERFPQPFGLRVTPSAGKVSIYLSWSGDRLAALKQVIDRFQDYFPDVVFDLTYIPDEELLQRYTQLAYRGGGPDILLGASDWRASLADQLLVEDLSPYMSQAFRETFIPVALQTSQYRGTQVCLPYELEGVVLYRNRKIVATAPTTFSQMVSLASQATKSGNLGAYFEGGSYFSLAHLAGLGGQLLDEDGKPLFNQNQYQAAMDWLKLLNEMKLAGALELNGNRDLELFTAGKAGWIVEGTWNLDSLAEAVGTEYLAIDPWPAYSSGRLSGFVQSNCVYLNTNTGELSSLNHQAALNFIGYFLTLPVQVRLAETGAIPVLAQAQPTDPLIQQAMLALQGGTAYPAALDEILRPIYFTALDGVVVHHINQGQEPRSALMAAFEAIQQRISEVRP